MKIKSKIETVIVGVDFSPYSKIAVKQAERIAKDLGAKIVYVHVFEDPILFDWQRSLFNKEIMKHYTDKVLDYYALTPNENIIAKHGSPYKQLVAVAKKFSKPLIVVGHRGHSNAVAQFFLGSTAERLSLYSPFPVWIHRGEKITSTKKVLVPCDLSERSQHALKATKKLRLGKTQVEYLHISEPPMPVIDFPLWQLLNEKAEIAGAQRLTKFKANHSDLKVVKAFKRDVADEIGKEAKSFDLIAISPRKHGGLFRSFGSITSKVVRTGHTPVLVVP